MSESSESSCIPEWRSLPPQRPLVDGDEDCRCPWGLLRWWWLRTGLAAMMLVAMASCSPELATQTPAGLQLEQRVLTTPPDIVLGEVPAIVGGKDGQVYVFHRGAHPLLEFDRDGEFRRELAPGVFERPHGLRLDARGRIWATDTQTHQVIALDTDGRVDMVLGMRGKAGRGWFDRDYDMVLFDEPMDVAFDAAGNIYVADKGNARVVKFDASGRRLRTWGTAGSEDGQFQFLHSIVVVHGCVYVADRENQRIQIFDRDGNFLAKWTHVGYPYVLTVGPRRKLWMTDARRGRVVALDPLDGAILGEFTAPLGRGADQFGFVHGIHIADNDDIWLGEILNWRVVRLAGAAGRLLSGVPVVASSPGRV